MRDPLDHMDYVPPPKDRGEEYRQFTIALSRTPSGGWAFSAHAQSASVYQHGIYNGGFATAEAALAAGRARIDTIYQQRSTACRVPPKWEGTQRDTRTTRGS